MTKKEVKQIFADHGIKTNKGGIEMTESYLRKIVDGMARRCKFRNIKVLRMDNFEFSLPNPFKD